MRSLEARVRNGRLVVDELTTLPEGTEIDLTTIETGDDLGDQERAALHAALGEAWANAQAGHVTPAEQLIRKLRSDA